MPDLVIFFSLPVNQVAVEETHKAYIPTIGIVDSDCDPWSVTYPVPGNDDSPDAIDLYLRLFTQAVIDGKGGAKRPSGESESTFIEFGVSVPHLTHTPLFPCAGATAERGLRK